MFDLADNLRKQEWGEKNRTEKEKITVSGCIAQVLPWATGNHLHAHRMPLTAVHLQDRRLDPPTFVHQLPAFTGWEIPPAVLTSPHFQSALCNHANSGEHKEDPRKNMGSLIHSPAHCATQAESTTVHVAAADSETGEEIWHGPKSHLPYHSDAPLWSHSIDFSKHRFGPGH